MGTKLTHIFWTNRQEEALREIWVTEKPIKENLHLFGDHTYQAVLGKAIQMGLGKRPAPVRSKYSAVWDDIERLLKSGAQMTAKEISERLGFCVRHVTDLLNDRHEAKETGSPLVHIATWRRRGSAYGYVEVWCWGDGPDAPKPKAKTKDDLNRARRQRRAMRNAVASRGQFGAAVMQLIREAA